MEAVKQMNRASVVVGMGGLHRVIREFRKLNPEISIQVVEVFTLVALSEGTTASAIVKRMGIPMGTASRHIAYLGAYDRHKQPGLGLIEQREILADRRNKELRLTAKGRLFRDSLLDILEG